MLGLFSSEYLTLWPNGIWTTYTDNEGGGVNYPQHTYTVFLFFADCIITVHIYSSTHNSLQACDITLLQHSISTAWRRQPLITNYSFTSEQVRKAVICAHN